MRCRLLSALELEAAARLRRAERRRQYSSGGRGGGGSAALEGVLIYLWIGNSSFLFTGDDFTIMGGISQMIIFGRLELTKQITVTSMYDNVCEGDELIVLEVISYNRK